MFRDLFSDRLFIGGLAFFIFCVGGSLLYMQHVERETAREMAAHEEHIKQLTEKPKPKPKPTTVEAPVGEPPQQDGHVHADGTWHDGPHEPVVQPPTTQVNEPTIEINHERASLTDEERLQRKKEKNQAHIAGYANDPRCAELHKLMSENEYPYSPEVQAKIDAAYNRYYEKRLAYDKANSEINAKMSDPNLSAREFVRLLRERIELRNRYMGGQ